MSQNKKHREQWRLHDLFLDHMKKVSVHKGPKHFNFSSTVEDCVTQQNFLLERINAFYYMRISSTFLLFDIQ